MRFRQHKIAIITDVSKIYWAVALSQSDCDLHHFVWRDSPDDELKDYHMTRLTFGISASAFIVNMCIKQNAMDYAGAFH